MKKILLSLIALCCLSAAGKSQTLTKVSRPSFDAHFMSKTVAALLAQNPPRTVTFKKIEEKTDSLAYPESCKAWMEANKIRLKSMSYHDGFEMMPMKNMVVETPWISKYGSYQTKEKTYSLSHVIEQDHVVLFFYGERPNEFKIINDVSVLVVRDKQSEKVKLALDFRDFAFPPVFTETVKAYVYEDLLWAYVDNEVLYVSHGHWTYSNASNEQNGYITAISLKTKKILWRTAPKVSNSINFVVMGDMLISAYGYTREGARLYAIDMKTGKICGEIEIATNKGGKKHIEYLYLDGKTLHVKAFDNTMYKVSVN